MRALDAPGVRASLDAAPALLAHRDPRGRSWLHLCCSIDVTGRAAEIPASIEIADDLVARGLEISDAAFTEDEGRWRATPVWCCVARGRNLPLAAHLLDQGADPNHSLWAAAFVDDLAAIDLLLDHGADLDPLTEDTTPFLSAVKTSHFAAAWHLAARGADIDVVDPFGMTALHYMLKKSSDAEHVIALVELGARLDIPNADGTTAADVLSRKRDPALRSLAGV